MASKSFGPFLLKIFGILAFCAVSAYALFLAYGYNLDLQHRNIEKTSIIDLASRYSELRVYMDDKLIGNSLPLQIKDLVAGFYHLTVQKSGYLPWNRQLQVRTDLVTKVDDLVLVPEHADQLQEQLARFPDDSRYFYGKDAFIVQSPGKDYLTLVYFLTQGYIKEVELKIQRGADIQDVQIYDAQNFLIIFEDGSYEWVDVNGPKFVDFTLPQGAYQLAFLSQEDAVFFLLGGNLYRLPIGALSTLSAKNLAEFLLVKGVDQFDVHPGKLVYLAKGLAYSADDQGKKIRLMDRSRTLAYMRYLPFENSARGLYILRTKDNKRSLYAPDERGISILLTPQLKDDVFMDSFGNSLFADESGNIFLYKPLLKNKILVTTLAEDFTLMGQLFDDGHFLLARGRQVLIADDTYTNVYPLFDLQEVTRYFLQNSAVYSLNVADHKLKSLFFLPR